MCSAPSRSAQTRRSSSFSLQALIARTTEPPPNWRERTRGNRQSGSAGGQSASRDRLRERDLIIRGVGCRSVGCPIQQHPEEDRVTPRIVQALVDDDALFDLRIGRGYGAPGGEI